MVKHGASAMSNLPTPDTPQSSVTHEQVQDTPDHLDFHATHSKGYCGAPCADVDLGDKIRTQYASFLSTNSIFVEPAWSTAHLKGEFQVNITPAEQDVLREELVDDEQEESCVLSMRSKAQQAFVNHTKILKYILLSVLFIAYTVYLAFAIRHHLENSKALVVITGLVVLAIIYTFVRNHFGQIIFAAVCHPADKWITKQWRIIQWFLYPALVLAIVLYLSLDVIKSGRQLQPILGMAIFVVIPFITCKYPNRIIWRPVLWGFALQFILGILVMRWIHGFNAVKFLANEINKFLFYSLEGAAVTFGDPFFLFHPFLTVVVPLIVYLGAVLAIMYYTGLTQLIATKVGWFMQITLKTTAIESISLGANIFLSVLDTVLMLKPYIPLLTESEFHCFLVGAHSTIAGFAFGLFVLFGVSPQHLLTGAVMSAPAAVAVSKLNWPETEQSVFTDENDFKLMRGTEHNWVEAATNGAWAAAKSVAAILIQVIAFMSVFFFVDATVVWFGARVGITLDISIIFGWIFTPVAFIMGVDWEDCSKVGTLLGLKVVANEFLGYIELGRMNRNREISPRSAAIATYAMCGFSSFGTLAIFVGVWAAVDSKKTTSVVKQIPRILLNTNVACFLTACIAGIFYSEDIDRETAEPAPFLDAILGLFNLIPSARDILGAVGIIP